MDEWPIVGRDIELRRLRSHIQTRTGVVLVGPPGVGKTTLARACVEEAHRRGMSVARTTATRAARSLPLGALAPLLPAEAGLGADVGDAVGLVRRSVAALVEGAGGRPMLLVVDDAQNLDDTSAAVVHALAESAAATVVVTVPEGEPAPDGVAALWRDRLVERIDVAVLESSQVRDLLAKVFDGAMDPATTRQLVERCAGNPLFLRELVAGGIESGSLRREHGVWRVAGMLHASPRLLELIEHRLGHLHEDERDLLHLVALDEPLGQAEVAALSAPGVVDALERRAVVTRQLDGDRLQVWLAHPLYGDAARTRLTALRRWDLARRRAEVIERFGLRRREDALRVASWRLLSGGGSVHVLLAGALAARARNDPALTWRLATAAIDAGAGFDGRFLAAEAAFLRGDMAYIDEHVEALREVAVSDAERAHVATLRSDVALYLRGDPDVTFLDEAERTIVDPYWRDELLARRLSILWLTKGPTVVAEAAEPLLLREGSLGASFAALVGAMAFSVGGRIGDALGLIERSSPDLTDRTTSGPWYSATRQRMESDVLVRAGRLDEAIALVRPAYEDAVATANLEVLAFMATAMSYARLEQGHARSALALANEAARVFGQLGRLILLRDPLLIAARAAALLGDADEAARFLARLEASGIPPFPDDSDVRQSMAWTAVAAGEVPRARQLLEEAAAIGEAMGNLVEAARSWYGLARLGRASEARTKLGAVSAPVEGELVSGWTAHVDALADGDAAGLEAVAERFSALGADLYAAEAMSDAAVIWRRAGRRGDAAAAARRAAELVARCEGAVTPALGATESRVRLAPAELDTARLAAAGQSNREIAETLGVSVRTVENRLQRVYEKLGVTGRLALPAALERL